MKSIVIFGAGNVGRGNLGDLFSAAGYRLVFVDVDKRLIAGLGEAGGYTHRSVGSEIVERRITDVEGVTADDAPTIVEKLATAGLCATAVGQRHVGEVAPRIAEAVELLRERGDGDTLDVIVCENMSHAAGTVRNLVYPLLSDGGRAYAEKHLGLVDADVERMVPNQPADLLEKDPLGVAAEWYRVLPVDGRAFKGEPPAVPDLVIDGDFEINHDKKLYINSCGHAIAAYMGYALGHHYIHEAVLDRGIEPVVRGALVASARAIQTKYGKQRGFLAEHVQTFMERMANPNLFDDVLRVGRDPIRKLGPHDRLIGTAHLVSSQRFDANDVALGAAYALRFDDSGDAEAVELQRMLAQKGVESVLTDICGLAAGDEIARKVTERYYEIVREPRIARADE